jgi:hypothetical protein
LSALRSAVLCGPEDHVHGAAELADYRLRLANRIRVSFSRSRSGRSPASFGILLSTAVRASILWLSSAMAKMSSESSATTQVFPPATISRGAGPRFYALRESHRSILRTLVNPNMDIGIIQNNLERCSPLIYCLQVRDVHCAECLMGNRESVRPTSALKYGPALEFVLREQKIGSLRLLFRGASNQVNVPTPGIGMFVEEQRTLSTPSRMRTRRWRLFCAVFGHGPAPSLSEVRRL